MPGETILITAAVFAGLGKLNIFVVILVGFIAAFLGDNLGYAIGKYGGRSLLSNYGKYVLITDEKLDKATAFFERNGVKVVVIARFIEGLRQLNGILAGISSMTWKTFAPFNALGAAIWVITWASVGYFGGSQIDTIEKYGTYVAVGAAVAVVGYLVYRFIRSKRRPKTAATTGRH